MSVVSIPLPPTGKGMETLFKQLRAVFSPAVAILRREAPRSSASHGRPVWVPIAGEIGTLGDSSRLVSVWISRWEAWRKGTQEVMGRSKTKGRNSSSPSPLKLPLTALISLKLIVDWKTTGDESGTAAPDCDAGYRGPIDFDSCSFIISNLTLLKLDFKNMHLTSKPLHWTTALKSQETLHPLFYKCVTAFCNSFVTSSLCMPSKNVTWQIRSNYTAVPITISTTMYVSYLFTEKNI